VVIEDEAVHARWLAACVAAMPGLSAPLMADSVDAALLLLRRWAGAPPRLVLLDLSLGGLDGLQVLAPLRAAWPQAAVMVVSQRSDENSVLRALRGGARGYLVKDGDTEAARHAMASVLSGQVLLSPAVARHLINLHDAAAPAASAAGAPAPRLSAREHEVLECIARGLSYDEVAAELALSRSTVETHVRNLYRKLEANSKVSAVRRAGLLGLLGLRR
jgi:DNA-binding NarL/FixJ family response regulator